MATNWADWAQTKRSYELFARYVMPHFQGTNTARQASMEWTANQRPELQVAYTNAVQKEIKRYSDEQNEG